MSGADVTKEAMQAPRAIAIATGAAVVAALGYSIAEAEWVGLVQVLWCGALWIAGVVVGFLFAIPKVLQPANGSDRAAVASGDEDVEKRRLVAGGSPSARLPPAYQLMVNTNLEQISDWLTKILVGATLIELKEIPSFVNRLAVRVASSFPDPNRYVGYATAVVILFCLAGFLFGYLVTRLFIQRVLAQIELAVTAGDFSALELRLESSQVAEQSLRATLESPPVEHADVMAGQEALQKLADDYGSIHISDYRDRVREKNRLAAEMVKVVRAFSLSRDSLADSNSDAMILALAATAVALPMREDVRRLIRCGGAVKRLHVRYHVIMAFEKLLSAGFVSTSDRQEILEILKAYESGADASLKRRIEVMRGIVREASQS